MANKKFCRIPAILASFTIAIMGCGSNPSSVASQQPPVDPQQLIGTWLQDANTQVIDITIRSDYSGSWTTHRAGRQPSTFDVRVINGGRTITDGESSFSIRINEGKLILTTTDGSLTFSKAQPVEVADSIWVQENNAFVITYTFANDGTYKIEYGGMAASMEGAQLKHILDELSNAGIDGTGTYTVSEHYVILKPNGGTYIAATPPGNFEKIDVETYTLVFVNGNELFHGYYYEKK